MSNKASDIMLVLAWVFVVVSVPGTSPISTLPTVPRSLWTILLGAVTGFALYWLSNWQPAKEAQVSDASATSALVGEIRAIHVFVLPKGPVTGIMLQMVVRNPGLPTVADTFGLNIATASAPAIAGQWMSIPDGGMHVEQEGHTITFPPSDDLADKTAHPVITGGNAVGILYYTVPGDRRGEITKIGSVLTVSFRDGFNKSGAAAFTIEAPFDNSRFMRLPGINAQIK